MKKMLAAAVVAGLSWLLGETPGYGAETKDYDEVMTAMVKKLNDTAAILEKIKDKASADKEQPGLKKVAAEMKELKAKSDKLGKPSKEQEAELKKKHEKDIEAALKKLTGEAIRLSSTDYGKDALKELQNLK